MVIRKDNEQPLLYQAVLMYCQLPFILSLHRDLLQVAEAFCSPKPTLGWLRLS